MTNDQTPMSASVARRGAGDSIETIGWTARASELRIRLLLDRDPTPELNRALYDEARRLATLQAFGTLSH